jgi:hypothetical protein
MITQYFEFLVEWFQVFFPLGQVRKQNVSVKGSLFGERSLGLVEVLWDGLHTLFDDCIGLKADLFQVKTLQVFVLTPCNLNLIL